MGLHDCTVWDFICRNARIFADRESIIFNDNRLTHKQYKEKSEQLAAGLIKAGAAAGDRLGVVAHNSDEFMILYAAAAKMGAIILPVNWRLNQDEVEFVLNDCTPKFVFAGQEYRDTVKEAVSRVQSIERCYTIGGGEGSGDLTPFAELYSEDGANAEYDIAADSGFVIIHTAAVAGRPRGALLSQGNIVAANYPFLCQGGMDVDGCHICILPLYHIAGLVMAMATLHAGGKNVMVERFDPELTLSLIEKEKGTTFGHFAPVLSMLLKAYEDKGGGYDLSSLRTILGMDSPDNIIKFGEIAPVAQAMAGYAQTEAMSTTLGPALERPGSAGLPTIISNVRLLDDHDNEVPAGTPGEICVRSPSVFLGYWGLDEDTAYTFRNDWHHTGDIGRFDDGGFLWYLKRKAEKELIKPGGENVYPAEVEKVILQHEAVAEVSVIGVADPQWGEAVKAVAVLKKGHSLEAESLIDFVASRIARYKKPKFIHFIDALPKTKDGEIDRDQVKKKFGAKY